MGEDLASRLRLMVVTDVALAAPRALMDVVGEALKAGTPAVQLRNKDEPPRGLVEIGRELRALTRDVGALFIVNDRVDVALASGADGAQLREDSLDPLEARRILGAAALLGVSRHGKTLDAGSLDGADFVLWGSVFGTVSHPGRRAAGLEALGTAIGSLRGTMPVIAIGGITPERVAPMRAAGAHGIAALSGIWVRGAAAVEEYRAALASGPTLARSGRQEP